MKKGQVQEKELEMEQALVLEVAQVKEKVLEVVQEKEMEVDQTVKAEVPVKELQQVPALVEAGAEMVLEVLMELTQRLIATEQPQVVVQHQTITMTVE